MRCSLNVSISGVIYCMNIKHIPSTAMSVSDRTLDVLLDIYETCFRRDLDLPTILARMSDRSEPYSWLSTSSPTPSVFASILSVCSLPLPVRWLVVALFSFFSTPFTLQTLHPFSAVHGLSLMFHIFAQSPRLIENNMQRNTSCNWTQ